MSEKIFIGDSICSKNHRLFCRCRQLKRLFWINSAWFFNSCVYIKVGDNSEATKVKHLSHKKRQLIWKTLLIRFPQLIPVLKKENCEIVLKKPVFQCKVKTPYE